MAPPAFERAVAYALYQDGMRAAIHALKYDRMHPSARRLGEMLAQAIGTLAADAPEEMLVVPVPLHRARHADRGFNQARLLASHALNALRKSHPSWRLTLASSTLMRLRATDSQANLSPRQRRLNVRGAFVVSDPAAIQGRHILLIDDIFTTGATARAAALALKRAGAESVWVATLARARRFYTPGSFRTAQLDRWNAPDTDHKDNGSTPAQVKESGLEQQARMHSTGNQPSF